MNKMVSNTTPKEDKSVIKMVTQYHNLSGSEKLQLLAELSRELENINISNEKKYLNSKIIY